MLFDRLFWLELRVCADLWYVFLVVRDCERVNDLQQVIVC